MPKPHYFLIVLLLLIIPFCSRDKDDKCVYPVEVKRLTLNQVSNETINIAGVKYYYFKEKKQRDYTISVTTAGHSPMWSLFPYFSDCIDYYPGMEFSPDFCQLSAGIANEDKTIYNLERGEYLLRIYSFDTSSSYPFTINITY